MCGVHNGEEHKLNLKELGKKYGIVILDDETIEDLKGDVEQSKKILEKMLGELERIGKEIQEYKQVTEITKAYAERIERLSKVLVAVEP